jgi:sugar phosphate isomerase/epimerase
MQLSVTTDFFTGTGNPEPYLKQIYEAEFSHIHWCHHWDTDFIYSSSEIAQIKKWLKEYNLQICDLHASDGTEKCWYSEKEYERLAGVELVKNRINMVSQLDSDVIIMHTGLKYTDALRKSLDEIESYAKIHGVRIACENSTKVYFDVISQIFADYSPDYIGLCYDSGHGNLDKSGRGLNNLEEFKDRLISVHLHDNFGDGDDHLPPFYGNIDWEKLTDIVSKSSYKKMISMEVSQPNSKIDDTKEFLNIVYKNGSKLTEMLKSK